MQAIKSGAQGYLLKSSLRKELTDIQYGRLPDRHNWLVKLG